MKKSIESKALNIYNKFANKENFSFPKIDYININTTKAYSIDGKELINFHVPASREEMLNIASFCFNSDLIPFEQTQLACVVSLNSDTLRVLILRRFSPLTTQYLEFQID